MKLYSKITQTNLRTNLKITLPKLIHQQQQWKEYRGTQACLIVWKVSRYMGDKCEVRSAMGDPIEKASSSSNDGGDAFYAASCVHCECPWARVGCVRCAPLSKTATLNEWVCLSLGGFHVWRPQRRGEGVQKWGKFSVKQYIFCRQTGGGEGVKKSLDYVNVIYGRPLIAISCVEQHKQNVNKDGEAEFIYCPIVNQPWWRHLGKWSEWPAACKWESQHEI